MKKSSNNWLLLDLSTSQMGFGFFDGEKLKIKIVTANNDTNRQIVSIIQKLGATAGPLYFTRVGVVQGPGAFTGVRTAAVVANGVSFAMRNLGNKFSGIEVVDSLSSQLPAGVASEVISVIPSGRDEVYCQYFKKGQKKGKMSVVSVAGLGSVVESGVELVGVLPHYSQDKDLAKIAKSATKTRLNNLFTQMQSEVLKKHLEILPIYGKEPNITISRQ